MDPRKWQQVKQAFERLVDLPADKRVQELTQLNESDPEVGKEVESLLDFDSQKQVICSSTSPLEGNVSGAIIGPYRLNFPLAINDRSEVWQAVNTGLSEASSDRKVAIKFFKDLSGDERREKRFRQEAAILSRFEHPGIARFLEDGETGSGVPWFSMAYVEGLDLITMANRKAMNLDQRLTLFDQVLAAVEYSHRFFVIHRDLKPSNIVVDDSCKATLIDFGISKQIEHSPMYADDLTRTYERTLTPAYASPEQVRGEPVSAVTDVYGAGLVLYELICGHHPYSDPVHESDKPLMDRILFEMPIAPSDAARLKTRGPMRIASGQPTVGAVSRSHNDLDQIILRAIAKSPSHRFQSISDFRQQLMNYREGSLCSWTLRLDS